MFNRDNYGNVRLASRSALENLSQSGLRLDNRFDQLDALETREDLEALSEVLSSVRDRLGSLGVFTPYALAANPAFTSLRENQDEYRYEDLPSTFARLAAENPQSYEGAWAAWQTGMEDGLLKPEFHGSEHLNLRLLEQKLACRDSGLMANIGNDSMAGLSDEPDLKGVGFTHAFGVADRADMERHKAILSDGIALFERVFGRPAQAFTRPAQRLHPDLYAYVESKGIRAIDKPLHLIQQLDRGKVRREINILGRKRGQGHVTLVRNVVFEPNLRPGTDEVGRTLSQIAAAFRWGKPAMISSHRVNFCGHIQPANRRAGLAALKRLLDEIVRRWPDVEFIGAGELAERIEACT